MEHLLLNTQKILDNIAKFIKIKKKQKLELTEMEEKFISSLNGKILATKFINRSVNKDYSNFCYLMTLLLFLLNLLENFIIIQYLKKQVITLFYTFETFRFYWKI